MWSKCSHWISFNRWMIKWNGTEENGWLHSTILRSQFVGSGWVVWAMNSFSIGIHWWEGEIQYQVRWYFQIHFTVSQHALSVIWHWLSFPHNIQFTHWQRWLHMAYNLYFQTAADLDMISKTIDIIGTVNIHLNWHRTTPVHWKGT